jgi:hypothetical protein
VVQPHIDIFLVPDLIARIAQVTCGTNGQPVSPIQHEFIPTALLYPIEVIFTLRHLEVQVENIFPRVVLFKVVFVEIAAFFAEILPAQPTDETDLLFKKKRLRYFDPLLWHRSGISAEKKCLQ